MAVFFQPRETEVDFEVGEYQEFPKSEPEDPAAKETPKSRCTLLRVILVSFGLLCVLQAILNIVLRLPLSQPIDKGETEVDSSCPEDWLMFGSSCYYISTQRRNWDNSRRYCLQRDADLVIINSRQEQAFLTGFTEVAWVGMTDRMREGTWIWVDGTPVDKDGLNWAPGQPDGAYGGEDCGDIHTMKDFIGLNDLNCTVRVQWICEKML